MNTEEHPWKYLTRKPNSSYRQLFVKDRWVRARTLYGLSVGEDAQTPQELADDFNIPVAAVLEAIAYCQSNPPELREDWEREEALVRASEMDDPKRARLGNPKLLTPQELHRLSGS